FLANTKEADLAKDFHPGDIVELSYSSRRFPSTEVSVIDHDPKRTLRFETFTKLMQAFPAPKIAANPLALREFEKEQLKRPGYDKITHAAEDKAAEDVFKLIEEAPADPVAYRFLTELLAMHNPATTKKASELLVKHHLKDSRVAAFFKFALTRARASDHLFE